MAKDPAFLFYPGDWLGGTMGMTLEEKGAYMELLLLQFNRGHMTKHMMGQTVGQLLDKLLDKFKIDDKGLYYNPRLKEEKEKRKSYVSSRLNNKTGNNQWTKKRGHTSSHMEDENINSIIKGIESLEEIQIPEIDKKMFMYLIVEMGKMFKAKNPEYPFNKVNDYHACLNIAYNIAELKEWTKHDVINGKMNLCLESWNTIVDFIKKDEWLTTRSLSDLSKVNEWQRLVLKMNTVKKEKIKKNIVV